MCIYNAKTKIAKSTTAILRLTSIYSVDKGTAMWAYLGGKLSLYENSNINSNFQSSHPCLLSALQMLVK